MSEQLEFRVPAPTANSYGGYLAWLATEDGRRAWARIQEVALLQVNVPGCRRVSTKALVERVRAELKIEINNSWTSRIADSLIERYPAMANVIQRRRRKVA